MSGAATGSRKGWLFGTLLFAAVATSAFVWWVHGWPVLTGRVLRDHIGHNPMLSVHVVGGSFMILSGAANLFIGWTRLGFRFHKFIGYSYLLLGGIGAVSAIALSISLRHPPVSVGVATATLGAVWLTFAAMAWRAAKNRRFETHREWVIRSYVVTWTFVGCRLAQSFPLFGYLGAEGITAGIWLYWVVPVIVCEVALQWRRGAALRSSGLAD